MKKVVSYLIIASLVIGIGACKKRKLNKQTTSTEDNNRADAYFTDVFNVTSSEVTNAENEQLQKGVDIVPKALLSVDTCADVTYTFSDDSTYLDTVIIDFGTNNSCEVNGRVRRGKLNIYLTGKFRQAGTVTTIVPEDFYIDDYQVEGQKVITNIGLTPELYWQYTVSVTDAKITAPNGDTFTWESQRTNEWRILQGEFGMTGSASGVNRNGRAFDILITDELVAKTGCKWIVSGTFELTPEDLATRYVDYGDGACDNKATVTINDNEYEVNMN